MLSALWRYPFSTSVRAATGRVRLIGNSTPSAWSFSSKRRISSVPIGLELVTEVLENRDIYGACPVEGCMGAKEGKK